MSPKTKPDYAPESLSKNKPILSAYIKLNTYLIRNHIMNKQTRSSKQ